MKLRLKYMKKTRTSSILALTDQGQGHLRKIFLHLLQYKLSGPITQDWYKLGS